MRTIPGVVLVLAVLGLNAGQLMGQDVPTPSQARVDQGDAALQPIVAGDVYDDPYWSGDGCRPIRGPARRRIVEAGYFNCACRGSYKFPVPPQYTYHWPGMYSQQTMTEYNSPWRFPPLNLPKEESVAPGLLDAPIEAPSDAAKSTPGQSASEPETMSEKIKRHYGVE